ncbi:hypothetical protein BJX99DRAFT_230995 [Aspergillus californicus]
MSGSTTVEGDIFPACDLCHTRKIKCDRQAPCANCVDARVECERLRRGRSSKKRTLQRMLDSHDFIMNLERPASHPEMRSSLPRARVASNNLDGQNNPGERIYDTHGQDPDSEERSPATNTPWTASADGSNYHAIQAKNIIELELDDSRYINRDRQALLKSALQLVNRLADSEPRCFDADLPDGPAPAESAIITPESPPRELLFMLLRGPPEAAHVDWPDHISDKTYEKMATVLLQGSQDRGQLFHRYCVCVYVKAIFHLDRVSRLNQNPAIKSQLAGSRKVYIAATLQSIEHLSLLEGPDISSIQCLLSSALLMQHLGRLSKCWLFTSYAARQIAALNYHKITKVPADTDEEREIHRVVYWCYYLDRTLSSLLGLSPSLPDLKVSPVDLVSLDPSSHYAISLPIVLSLSQIQGQLHALSDESDENNTKSKTLEVCQQLESDMEKILPSLQSNRDSLPKTMQCDWAATDFCYYAIFVEIHRTRLKACFSPLIHRQCLLHARRSLKAFHFLQKHPTELRGFEDPYPTFLTWTLLFYPLSAFFVVFCNIIGTLDRSDYTLLHQITQSLSPFKQDPHLGRLLTLLQSLEQLCEPLFQQKQQAHNTATSNFNNETPACPTVPTVYPAVDNITGPFNQDQPAVSSFPDDPVLANGPMADVGLDASADWMMWQLFNSQIPAGWMNPGFDPFNG